MAEYYAPYQWRQENDSERCGPVRPPGISSVFRNVQRRREYENNKTHRIYNNESRPCGPTSSGLRESTTVNRTHSRQEYYTPAKQRRYNVESNQTVSSRYQGQQPQEKHRQRLTSRDTNTTPMSNSRTGYKQKRLDVTPSRLNNKLAGQDRNRSNRQKDTSYLPAKAAQPHHDKPKPLRVKGKPITLQRAPLSSTGRDAQDIRRRAIGQEQPCSSHTVPTQPSQSTRQPSPKQTPPRVKRNNSVKRPWRNAKLTRTPDSEDCDSDEDNNAGLTRSTEYNYGAAPQEEENTEIQRHSLTNGRALQEGNADDASSSDSSASDAESHHSGSSGSSSSGSSATPSASSSSDSSDSSDSEDEVALPEEHKSNSQRAASTKKASLTTAAVAATKGSSPTVATTSRQVHGIGKGSSGTRTREHVGVLPRKQMSNQRNTHRKPQSGSNSALASEQSTRPTVTTQTKVTSPAKPGETHSRSTPPGPRTAMQTPHHKHRARGQAARTTPQWKRKPGVVNGQEVPNGEKPKLDTQQTTPDLRVLSNNQAQDIKCRWVASVQVEESSQKAAEAALKEISSNLRSPAKPMEAEPLETIETIETTDACRHLTSITEPREEETIETIETSDACRHLASITEPREEEPLCPTEASSQLLPFDDSDSTVAVVSLQCMRDMCNTTIKKNTSDEPAEQPPQDEVPKYQNHSELPHESPDETVYDILRYIDVVPAPATADNVVLYQGAMQQQHSTSPRLIGSERSRETTEVPAAR